MLHSLPKEVIRQTLDACHQWVHRRSGAVRFPPHLLPENNNAAMQREINDQRSQVISMLYSYAVDRLRKIHIRSLTFPIFMVYYHTDSERFFQAAPLTFLSHEEGRIDMIQLIATDSGRNAAG